MSRSSVSEVPKETKTAKSDPNDSKVVYFRAKHLQKGSKKGTINDLIWAIYLYLVPKYTKSTLKGAPKSLKTIKSESKLVHFINSEVVIHRMPSGNSSVCDEFWHHKTNEHINKLQL